MKNFVFFEVCWVAFFMLLIFLMSTCVVSLYLIESNSMEPGIIPGDRILVNRLAYGLSFPWTSAPTVSWAGPKRGEVIFFKFDGLDDIFVKRVIGLPGDDISFKRGIVYVNSFPISQETVHHPLLEPESKQGLVELLEMQSRLNVIPHHILMSQQPDRTFFETARYAVPQGHYFVLGDNRDDSADSRQYGFVSEAHILGRAVCVVFSTTEKGFLWPNFRVDRFATWQE